MTDSGDAFKLQIDSDWKAEAQREKERLTAEEAKSAGKADKDNAPDPTFLEIVNVIAMQAVIGLGGFAGPGGERIPADPAIAKHHIDMLEVLAKKTAGNLADDEKKVLDRVLYELRQHFVEIFAAATPPTAAPA